MLLAVLLLGWMAAAQPAPPSERLTYTHDGLRLDALLYLPQGTGPFPLVVYNHGSAPPGDERIAWPAPYIARLFVPAGYAVLVPERRGYGRSEGRTFSEAVGSDRGAAFVRRQDDESGDVNAAVDYVVQSFRSSIDARRIVVMGWSFGGVVTTLAASRGDRYAGAIVQAPGSLNWNRSPELRKALVDAAGRIRVPLECAVAENDATTESAKAVCAAASQAGARTVVKIYPPFSSGRERPGNPPGHAIFSAFGVDRWRDDALAFIAETIRGR